DQLGKGVVMVRCGTVKQSAMMRVPFVDNKSLYTLLGPSTYTPANEQDEDDLLADLVASSRPARRDKAVEEQISVEQAPPAHHTYPESDLDRDERAFLAAYRAGRKSGNAISAATGIPATRVNKHLNRLSALGLIDWQPKG